MPKIRYLHKTRRGIPGIYVRNSSIILQNMNFSRCYRNRAQLIYSFDPSIIIYQSYYEKNKDLRCANRLMESLWREMYALANLPLREASLRLRELKKRKLYPYRPPLYTLSKSYATTRTDLVGKVFEKIWCNMHTRKGFWLMRVWIMLINGKNILKNSLKLR